MLKLDVCASNDKWLNLHLMLFAYRMPALDCGDVDTAYCGIMCYLVNSVPLMHEAYKHSGLCVELLWEVVACSHFLHV